MTHLNAVDNGILVIFLFSILFGLWRGFVKESLSLVVLVAAFLGAIFYAKNIAFFLKNTHYCKQLMSYLATTTIGFNLVTPASYGILILSFILLFSFILLLGTLFTFLIHLILASIGLGFGNRLLGGIFGFFRACIVMVLLLFILQFTSVKNYPAWRHSKIMPWFQTSIFWLNKKTIPYMDKLKQFL
jgi:membrane protein required for colicin V production